VSPSMPLTWGDASGTSPVSLMAVTAGSDFGPARAAKELGFSLSNDKSGFASKIGVLRLKSSSAVPRVACPGTIGRYRCTTCS
jgi:hypothetical protein